MKFNYQKRALVFVLAFASISVCMVNMCLASENEPKVTKSLSQESALQYFSEDSDIIFYGDMGALGKMPTLVDFYKNCLKSVASSDQREMIEKSFLDSLRYLGTSALTVDVNEDLGSAFIKMVSVYDSAELAEDAFKGCRESQKTLMAFPILNDQSSKFWEFKTAKYKEKDAVLGEMKKDKDFSLHIRMIHQNDKIVTTEIAINQGLPETCFFDIAQHGVKNNFGFLSVKNVLFGQQVRPMSLIQKFVKEKNNIAANQEVEFLKSFKSINLCLLTKDPNLDIIISAPCTDEATADVCYNQYKPQFDQIVSNPAVAGFFMNAKMEKNKETLVVSATLNLPQVLSICQAQINQQIQQSDTNVNLDKIANEMDDVEEE